VRAKQAGQPHDEETAKAMIELGQRYLFMSETAKLPQRFRPPPTSPMTPPGKPRANHSSAPSNAAVSS